MGSTSRHSFACVAGSHRELSGPFHFVNVSGTALLLAQTAFFELLSERSRQPCKANPAKGVVCPLVG